MPQDGVLSWPPSLPPCPSGAVRAHAFARIGMMGNPSDGFHGKTVGTTVRNYWADAWMWPSDVIHLVPHPLYDPQVCMCVCAQGSRGWCVAGWLAGYPTHRAADVCKPRPAGRCCRQRRIPRRPSFVGGNTAHLLQAVPVHRRVAPAARLHVEIRHQRQ